MTVKIAVLVSGGGTNLQALIDAKLKNGKIVQVVSSNSQAYALERARLNNIRADVAERKNFNNALEFENKILSLLDETKPDVIILAGFMHILSANFVNKFKNRIINIHPALIPAFCGKGFYGLKVHEAALNYGVKVTGATVHLVNDIPDGGKILKQKAVKILPGDTPEILQRRVMEEAEWKILPQAAEELCMKINLFNNNSYPGRGIMIGCSEAGRLMLAYFIMGRSASSRARVFEKLNQDLIIKIIDNSKVKDKSLILYAPLRVLNNKVIVTNGDQTDTVYDFINHDKTFEDALRTREFEPDAPHFTPRISGILDLDFRKYKLNILKSGVNNSCVREFFEYEAQAGAAHLIHTYNNNAEVLPSFTGEPKLVENISDDIDDFAESLWNALDDDNKISLYVRYYNADNTFEDRLFNKYKLD